MQFVSFLFSYIVLFWCILDGFNLRCNCTSSQSTVCEVPSDECKEYKEFYSVLCYGIIRFIDPKFHEQIGCLRSFLEVDDQFECNKTLKNISDLPNCDKMLLKDNPKVLDDDSEWSGKYIFKSLIHRVFYNSEPPLHGDEDPCVEFKKINQNITNMNNEKFLDHYKNFINPTLSKIRKSFHDSELSRCVVQLNDVIMKHFSGTD